METKRTCQHCGKTLGPEAIEGLCPECLMKMGLGIGTEATAAAPQGKRTFLPPTIAEIAPKFPHFEIVALIGHGGMGAVYKARQKHLERVVALKILPPGIGEDLGFADRFAREARAMARLNHPGIVTIHDFGCADGLYFLVMEFVDGVSLGQLMRTGRVSPREALAIVPQICDALQYAHDHGIVHRDIKPENILLDRQGRVKVADFGLAKLVGTLDEPQTEGTRAEAAALTQAGKTMGTPSYMAPEQVGDPAAVDHRADIYALGVVFYQMLTGELPSKPIEAPSRKVQIDVRLDEVVLCALEKAPERRYQQVSHIKTAVETIAQTSTGDRTKSESETGWTPGSSSALKTVRGSKGRVLAAAVALLAVGLVSAMLVRTFRAHQAEIDARSAKMKIRLAPIQISTVAIVRKGDIGVYINALGSVESSNSVAFAIPEDFVREVVREFDDAHAAQSDKSALSYDWHFNTSAPAPLTIEAYDRSFKETLGQGFLTSLDNQIDPATGTLKCKASVITDGNTLMIPGMFLNIRLFVGTKQGVILVPTEAILSDQQSAFVWKIRPDDTVTRRDVEVGIKEGGEAEVIRGLSPEDLVVGDAKDLKVMREGQRVRFNRIQTIDFQPVSNSPKPLAEWVKMKPLADWITDLHNSDPKIQRLAEEAITVMGTNALPEFLKILSEKEPTAEDRERHYQTAEALRFIGPNLKAAIPAFVTLLKSGGEETAYSGATALAFATLVVPEAFAPLTNGLIDPEAQIRDAATHGVGLLFNLDSTSTRLAEPALPTVMNNLKDKVDYVRADTAAALYLYAYRQHLENRDSKPGMIIPPLTDLLQDRYPWARIHAARALAEYGTNADSAVPSLSQLLNDTDPQVRKAATDALRAITSNAIRNQILGEAPETLVTNVPTSNANQPGAQKARFNQAQPLQQTRATFYFVGGEGVALPGRRVFQPGLTVMTAIKACGGFTGGAIKSKAELTHDGSNVPLIIDITAIEQGNAPNPEIMPGDKLWVPASPHSGP